MEWKKTANDKEYKSEKNIEHKILNKIKEHIVNMGNIDKKKLV